MERFILPKSKEGIIASTREKARKRQALCRSKKSNEPSPNPTTSKYLEDTGNKQFASTSNHLEDTENQEQNIRSYNSSLAFASMGAKNDNLLNKGPYCFRVHGQIYHRTSHLYPPNGVSPKYAQLYVLETSQAIENRVLLKENSACDIHLLKKLDIRQINPYAISFKTLGEVEKAEEMKARLENRPISKVNMIFRRDRANDRRRFNIPTIDEVAMIFNNDDGEPPFQRDVKVYPQKTFGQVPCASTPLYMTDEADASDFINDLSNMERNFDPNLFDQTLDLSIDTAYEEDTLLPEEHHPGQ
ncbi:unnamed protein product [Gordionus sp. m RMFG-2023]